MWQAWNDPSKPWQGLLLPVDDRVRALFNASVRFHLGDGNKIKFWTDPWIDGQSLKDTVPFLFSLCARKNLTVAQALDNQRWTKHLRHELMPEALIEVVSLWEKTQHVNLQNDLEDSVTWRWTESGSYTAASAYAIQFEGAARRNYKEIIWSTDAPLRCRIFAWLAVQGRCLTADALAQRGWPHNEECALCLNSAETAQHLLAECPFMMQLWCSILPMAGLPACFVPQSNQKLADWLDDTRRMIAKKDQKSWTALAQLIWWKIWKERNARIFQRQANNLLTLKASIIEEAQLWRSASKR
jgi:hypothetical protein